VLGAVLAGCVCRETPLPSLSVTTPFGSRPVHSGTILGEAMPEVYTLACVGACKAPIDELVHSCSLS